MPKATHGPSDIRTYHISADRDTEPEEIEPGFFIDASNMRTTSHGSSGSNKKINGETVLYPNIDNRCIGGAGTALVNTYECLGDTNINGNIVEVWADSASIQPALIRINGKIVLMSKDFPVTFDHPLQLDKNESCQGGEVYITDFNVPPMFFNIQDLINNSTSPNCTTKYFADFNIDEYILQLKLQLDHPVFIELTSSLPQGAIGIGAQGSQEMGEYMYAHQYVDASGNATKLSPFTPLIPVIKRFDKASTQYPYANTFGREGGISSPYGVRLRIRITNLLGYDHINIVRADYKGTVALGYTPPLNIIYKFPISSIKLGVQDFVDFGGETLVPIPDEIDSEILSAVDKAKAIRYFDKRVFLMNIHYASRDLTGQVGFKTSSGNAMDPIMEKMGLAGHADPYNSTYYRAHMHDEKFGYSVVIYDNLGNKSFGLPIPGFDNFAMPSRRDGMGSVSIANSYKGSVKAATKGGAVSDHTFEIFDHTDAIYKTDLCSFKNIINNLGSGGCLDSGKDLGLLHQYCSDTPYNTVCLGARILGADVGFQPFKPTPNDANNTAWGVDFENYVINPRVFKTHASVPVSVGNGEYYHPKCFGLNYYSLGMVMQGLNKLPSWASGFTIARTKAAGKVLAQGVGFYSLISGENDMGYSGGMGKNLNEILFFSQDLENGIVSGNDISNLKADLSSYQIKVVSAVGFFAEVYNYNRSLLGYKNKAVDMIAYARILNDLAAGSQINPGESASMGIPDGSGTNHVGFGKWRQNGTNGSAPFLGSKADESSSSSTAFFDIVSIEDYQGFKNVGSNHAAANDTNARGHFFRIVLSQNIYHEKYSDDHFNDTATQNWTEPIYIVSIVKKNADVINNNINDYLDTGTYVKVKSLIGEGTGSPLGLILVDERWEDCCPTLFAKNTTDNIGRTWTLDDQTVYRYITVLDGSGNQRKWLNVTYAANLTTILNDITNNGFYVSPDGTSVYGVYKHTVIATGSNSLSPGYDVTLQFAVLNSSYSKDIFLPKTGDQIFVSYDSNAPIRVFGGDTTVGEQIFSPIDIRNKDENGNTFNGGIFGFDRPFPYDAFEVNPRYYIVRRTDAFIPTSNIIDGTQAAAGDIEPALTGKVIFRRLNPAQIRQLCVMFTGEGRTHLPYLYNVAPDPAHIEDKYFFPKVNYIMRPNEWDASNLNKNLWSTEYFTAYPHESDQWFWGGFRFLPNTNIEYSQQETVRIFQSKPKVGFKEITHFCSRIIWSAKRLINVQDDPNLRTFYATSFRDIEDRQGSIKFAWDGSSAAGANLYAFTDRGIALLLTNKRLLSQLSGDILATMAVADPNEVVNEEWLSKTIGMNDEMWRSAAEWDNILFFANKNSAYQFLNNEAEDIGRKKYHKKIFGEVLSKLSPGYADKVTAVYDTLFNEYWLHIALVAERDDDQHGRTFAFSSKGKLAEFNTNFWNGTYDYYFDKLLSFDNRTYGMRQMETYELNKGFVINGNNISNFVIGVCNLEEPKNKEFIRIRVNSNVMPVKIEFFDNISKVLAGTPDCVLDTTTNVYALKVRNGYEQYIPRKALTPNIRMQGRAIFFKIIHNKAEDFKIISSEIEYKGIH